MSDSPEALLKRIAQGDESAMADFYRGFESTVYRFILSRLNDSFEAADILNEVMLEVWRSAGRFEGRSAVSSWVLGIARYKTIDRLRKRRPEAQEELEDDIVDTDSPDPAEAVAASENSGFVQHCMEKLSAAHREVVHLAFFQDLSYGEIAAIVGCPEGTVKTRMFHAKRALQHCLAGLMRER